MSSRVLALLVGIETYPNLDSTLGLRGTLADVEAMADLLRAKAERLDLRMLRDEQATRDEVLAALDRLVQDARPEDEVLFYWSGHGSQVRDSSGDDEDGWDETLVPYDSGRGRHPNRDILDDEIHDWLRRLTEVTPAVTLVVDACHSGTVARTGVRNVPRDPRPRAVSESRGAGTREAVSGPAGWLPVSKDWVLLAACRDDQMAIELPLGGRVRGAFTWALERAALAAGSGATWKDLFREAESKVTVATFGAQVPQLEGDGRRVSVFGSTH